MVKAAPLVAAPIIALALAGCLLPPFDVDLSLAFRSADKMDLEAEIGPVSFWGGGASAKELYFLPSQTPFTTDPADTGVSHGLLVAAGDYGPRVWYLDSDPWGGTASIYGDRRFVIDSTTSGRYNWQIYMIRATAAGGSDAFVLHDWTAASADTEDLTRVRYDRFVYNLQNAPAGTFPNPTKWSDLATAGGSLVGVSFQAMTNLTAFLEVNAGNYYEHRFGIDETDWSPFVPLRRDLLAPLPGAPANGFYQHDLASGRSVLSFQGGFGYSTWVWDGTLVPAPLPISKRIDVLLSTGELYHRGNGSDTVYAWDGRKKYEFPVGDLRLVAERQVGGVPTLFYSLVYWDRTGKDDEDQLYARVYTIPTADLDELE